MIDHRIGFEDLNDEIEVDGLAVEGDLPGWLSGVLVRNGPGRWDLEGGKDLRHWFDGLAMLHRFSFGDGGVSYADRFLRSPQYRSVRETGKIAYAEFATDPCRSIFKRLSSAFSPVEFGSNASVSVDRAFGDRFVARSAYKLFRVRPGTRRRETIAEIPAARPAYVHSFGQTERYAILAEYPLTLNPPKMLLTGKPYAENLEWRPEDPTRFHVVEKDTGRVAFVREADPFFCFHHVNAFERDGEVLVDLLAYPDPSIIENFYLDVLRDPARDVTGAVVGELRRYRLDPSSDEPAGHEVLSDERMEMPRIDYERVAGRTPPPTGSASARRAAGRTGS